MRLHSNVLTSEDLYNAARHARVDLTLTRHGSRTHAQAFEVSLTGESKRRPNSGQYGADNDTYAATWDQWGVFFAYLFNVDADMVAGLVKHPTYNGRDDFNEKTHRRFEKRYKDEVYQVATFWPEDAHGDHSWDFSSCRRCSAQRSW